MLRTFARFSLPPTRPAPSPAATPGLAPERRPKRLFLVTEDWYFCAHRLPVARAARDAGFEVVVAARMRAHAGQIRGEGLGVGQITWRRSGGGVLGAARAIAAITRTYRAERPDI